LLKQCIEEYPEHAMDVIKRSLKEQKESLRQRTKVLVDTKYTLDRTEVENGRAIIIKGTAKQLDDMHKATPKIFENLEKIIERFETSKSETARVHGGRERSESEKGLL
jgi:hypothetical protein